VGQARGALQTARRTAVVSAVAASDENPAGTPAPGVDPLGDPILHTRFALPVRPATFLRRTRLLQHLDAGLQTPLTMVNGAAGAGKTLLVADWAAGLRQPAAWLTVEADDQRPGVFWAYFLHALRAAGSAVTEEVGSPADAVRVDRRLLAALAAELSGRDRPTTVVLDEFDRETSAEVAEQLEFVLHHAGRGLRLVLVTRTEPMLPLHRYRAAGELTEIRGAELAFTPDEAVTLLELHGLRLPVQAARALVDRTRGWAAGLRLCALAAQQSADPQTYLKEFEADRSTVADFLLAEVLKRQPEHTQDLLLRVSVLERCCPDLGNALTGRGDAEPILAHLHAANAFVEDLGHSWYRLHPLFAEILRAHLRVRLPGLEPELHRRAAQWLRHSGSLPETLAHGAAAGDWEFTAGALVDDLAIGELFTGLRGDDLARLFSRMGPEAQSAATDVVRAARDLSEGDVGPGLVHLRHAEELLSAADPAAAAGRLSCALLRALAARLTGSPGDAEEAAEAARELRRQVPAHLLDKHPELTALLLTHLGSARLWAGRFEDARTALSAATGAPGGASTVSPREESMGHLALIDYLTGWPGRAERKATAALTETERHSLAQLSGSGMERLVLAAVAVERHELDRAQAFLDELAELPSAAEDPLMAAVRAIVTARLLLARGDARAAAQAANPEVSAVVPSPWAESQEALVASAAQLAQGSPETAAELLCGVPDDEPAYAVEAARIHLATGRADAAVDLLDGVRCEGRAGPAVGVRAALVRAQVAEQAGDTASASRLVAHALLDARRERLRRPFLEAGPWIRPLLVREPLRELTTGWLTPVAARQDDSAPPRGRPLPVVVEELSERERDVLRRLAQPMSTQEIAADLFVSVNTVKTHLKSVYRKLAVNRRNEAVRRARDLRLL
jgi:LuxR family transcriptional regulator, maltose regulon positive regulatory protein